MVAERDKTIDNLARNLKQKIADVLILEQTNKELREKLRKVDTTTKHTEIVAKEEYESILKELQRTNDGKEKLEADIRSLQQFLDTIKGKTLELESENSTLMKESYKVTTLPNVISSYTWTLG